MSSGTMITTLDDPSDQPVRSASLRYLRPAVAGTAILGIAAASQYFIADPKLSRAASIAGTCLVLWLLEVIPLFATTLFLWVGTILLLGPVDPRTFSMTKVVGSLASPVLTLFFGGFVLAVAGAKYGIDSWLIGWMLRLSMGRRRLLLLTVMAGTGVLSMWMSNIAAGALMTATLRPLADGERQNAGFRKALMLGVAFAADFGGIGTPIGTGPNLIAINALASRYPISFLDWMKFGVPLAGLMVLLAYLLLLVLHRVRGKFDVASTNRPGLGVRGWCVVAIFSGTVALWLTESLHNVPSAAVALGAAAALFATGLLDTSDLPKIEWQTLLLIAGGVSLGQLVDDSGLATAAAGRVQWSALHPIVLTFCLIAACALLSAVASNTASSAIMIGIAMPMTNNPSIAVLVALAASMGVPFVVSTPPNAMICAHGRMKGSDLLVPGLILMIAGCGVVTLAGPWFLEVVGVLRN